LKVNLKYLLKVNVTTMIAKVFVSRRIPEAALPLLGKSCQFELNERDIQLSKKQLIRRIADKDGLICLLTDRIDREILESNPNLKVVSNVAVGFDNIDVKAATARKIMVTNTPGVLTETTADLAWALLLASARRICEAERFTRAGKFKGWGIMMMLGNDVYGKTLGICGFGRIGRAVARRALGFGMRILYTDIAKVEEAVERELKATYVDKDTLLKESDFVTLHMPLLPETRHYISTRELNLMKKTAHLINTSRGPVVDEKSLAIALKKRTIAGAALDVYEEEPKINPALLKLENVVLMPHIGSASVETRTKMATMAVENCVAALSGKRPPNLVNPEVLQG